MMDSFETVKLPCQGITSSCFPKVTTVYLLVKPILNSSHHSIYQFKFLHFGTFHHCLILNLQLPTLATNYDDFALLQDHITCWKILFVTVPFLTFLKLWEKFLFPSHSKLICDGLNFSSSFLTEQILSILDFTVRRFAGTSGA